MAFIGLKYPMFAKGAYTDGSAPTYTSGAIIGRAIECNVSFSRSGASLFADDVEVESDNSITGGSVSLNIDDLADTNAVNVLGLNASGSGATTEYAETDENPPYGGFGYVRCRVHDGVKSYIGYWLPKVQFVLNSDDASTKNESTSFSTPTLDGKLLGCNMAAGDPVKFRVHETFSTEAAALAWVKGKLSIT